MIGRIDMKYASKLVFWVEPEHREAKLAYILGAETVTGFIRAIGPNTTLIENLIETIMGEMRTDKEAVLRAIAKMWGIRIRIERE